MRSKGKKENRGDGEGERGMRGAKKVKKKNNLMVRKRRGQRSDIQRLTVICPRTVPVPANSLTV